MKTIELIKEQISKNKVLLYMKGSPDNPNCGFSAKAAKIVSVCFKKFTYIDILQNPDIRNELPKFANWPTFPQLWVNGKLIGGCDIIIDMYNKKELQKLMLKTKNI